jgi:hypothetical protein
MFLKVEFSEFDSFCRCPGKAVSSKVGTSLSDDFIASQIKLSDFHTKEDSIASSI